MARRVNPYGDGQAAKRVVAALDRLLGDAAPVPEFNPEVEPKAQALVARS